MDADGRRFHLLLGAADWAGATAEPGTAPLAWDEAANAVGLREVHYAQPATPGEKPMVPEGRRAAAADRHGSIYAITDDRLALEVTSSGSQRRSRFWPPEAMPAPAAELFAPVDPAEPAAPSRFLAVAVTADDLLAALRLEADRSLSLLLFDLVGGGGPLAERLPEPAFPLRPESGDPGLALAPLADGGLALLDLLARRLWRFDRTLALVADTPPPAPALFQPAEGGAPREEAPPPAPAGLDLSPCSPEPIALAAWGDALYLLDRSGDVHRLSADASPVLVARSGAGAHDMVVAKVTTIEDPAALRLLVVHEDGNQARAFQTAAEAVQDAPLPETLLLRRFGGRALIAVRGFARFDGPGGAWTPVVEKPLRRFETSAASLLPPFDSGVPGTVWDSVVLDGCIPPGTRAMIDARAFDDDVPLPDFAEQPRPLLAPARVDLQWHAAEALPAPDRARGKGSHHLLLQGLRGRRLELRLRLTGDGSARPRIRALRAWEPRVSWVDRFLPAIYRSEDGDFLDRFLANFQGVFRGIEERIAGAQHLFDPETAPREALGWLAEWFDLALDPSWDERRRRLFIAHAETFFRWRGTPRGLMMALRAAFEPCAGVELFADGADRAAGIRLVEAHQVRAVGPLAAGDSGSPFVPRPAGGLWTPAEAAAGLEARLAEALPPELAPVPGGRIPLFSHDPAASAALAGALGFTPRGAAERDRWRVFQSTEGRAESALADLPEGPGDSLWSAFAGLPSEAGARWQDFLEGRYRRISRLREAHGTGWQSFTEVALPDLLPVTAAGQADWHAFETRVMPAAEGAHRFSVLLPLAAVDADPGEMESRLRLARRIVALEKPAHTIFDLRLFWALNRVGEARLGLDTQLGQGSRAPELMPEAVLGRAYLGAAFVGPDGPALSGDRRRIEC